MQPEQRAKTPQWLKVKTKLASWSFRLCLTEQLAELLVALLAFHFPFSGEGHDAGVGWSEASGDAEASGGKSEVSSVGPWLVYIAHNHLATSHICMW